MANQLADEVKKAEAVPSDAQLRAELEQERQARSRAEQEAGFFRGAASAEWQRAEAAKRQPVSPGTIDDPFAKLAADEALLDPEKRARLLDQGARERAREEVGKYARESEARRQMEREQDRLAAAAEAFAANHPEMVQDEAFLGATAIAKARNDQQRMNLSPVQLLNLAANIYNEKKAPAPNTPYTEGSGVSGPGGGSMKQPPVERELSMAETEYGAVDFVSDREMPVDKYTEKYLDDRNSDLVEKEKFWSGIRNVVGTLRETKSRRTASGR
jgi:hypothetical protein